MPKRSVRRSIDRKRSREFRGVAEHFFDAADAAMNLEYWTAAGVLIVHAAIAYADAISIKLSGQKSAGENHDDAIGLLDEVVAGGEEKTNALNQFRRIIEEKTRVSYLGDLYKPSQTRDLWKRLERFRRWADTIMDR